MRTRLRSARHPRPTGGGTRLNTTPETGPVPVPLIERVRRATLGRFDVMAVLGEGGMATVFLARDLQLDRRVAIKVMHPALMTSAAALGRFRREARIAAALDHPHIISIFAVGEDPELAYYVMRYVEGRTLHQVIAEEGAQPVRRVVGIVDATGQALNYAHRRGVIHRDVKPANVMVLDQDDWIVVTDFGIAKLDEDERLTLSGHVVGTPSYMSPEYFNHGRISAASDQYALGIMAFELLTGVVPYGGKTVGESMRGHILDAVPSVRELRSDLPATLDAVLTRMLSKEPSERFATVGDAVAAFRAAVSFGDAPEEKTEIIAPTPGGLKRRSMSISNPSVAQRRRVRTVGIAAAGVLVATSTILVWQKGLTPSEAAPPAIDSLAQGAAARGDDATGAPGAAAPRDPNQRASSTPRSRVIPTEKGLSAVPQPTGTEAPGTGTIRIGSRLALAALYAGQLPPRLIGEQGIQTIDVPSGPLRLSIRLDGCAAWDTTITVGRGTTHVIGYRAPRC